MILASLTKAIREQNWFAVVLEFLIVIAGVVIGFQITAWNEGRMEASLALEYLAEIQSDIETDLRELDEAKEVARGRIAAINTILTAANDSDPVWGMDGGGLTSIPPLELPESVPDTQLLLTASYIRTLDSADGVWETLIATGDVDVLRSYGDLLVAVQNYETQIANVRDFETTMKVTFAEVESERRQYGIGMADPIALDRLSVLTRDHPVIAAGMRTIRTSSLIQYVELSKVEARAEDVLAELEELLGTP